MVACRGSARIEGQSDAGILFWKDMKRIGREKSTLGQVANMFVRDGVLLSLFENNIALLTPILKAVVATSTTTADRLKKDFRNWERLVEMEKKVGNEYLIQFPSYMGIPSYFESAFWRTGWEKPVIFSFLNKERIAHTKADTKTIFRIHDDDYVRDYNIQTHRKVSTSRRKKTTKNDKRGKETRKARKTKKSDKTISRRLFPKEDPLLSPDYLDEGYEYDLSHYDLLTNDAPRPDDCDYYDYNYYDDYETDHDDYYDNDFYDDYYDDDFYDDYGF